MIILNIKPILLKKPIQNNDPIENKLNVIAVISNPCLFARRYILLKQFVDRIEKYDSATVNLFIVELAYKDQKFMITDQKNPNHLQLRTEVPLWHKENMINIAVQKLLPKNYKAFAWIDADLEFESSTWAQDTLKILNGTKDIVQIFSHAADLDHDEKLCAYLIVQGINIQNNYHFVVKVIILASWICLVVRDEHMKKLEVYMK